MRPFDSSPALYYKRSIITMRLSCTVMKIWRLKDNGVMSLTFWGHVTSSVTWPFDYRRSTSYGWSQGWCYFFIRQVVQQSCLLPVMGTILFLFVIPI